MPQLLMPMATLYPTGSTGMMGQIPDGSGHSHLVRQFMRIILGP